MAPTTTNTMPPISSPRPHAVAVVNGVRWNHAMSDAMPLTVRSVTPVSHSPTGSAVQPAPITAVRADRDREVNPAVAAAMSTARAMVTSSVTDMG